LPWFLSAYHSVLAVKAVRCHPSMAGPFAPQRFTIHGFAADPDNRHRFIAADALFRGTMVPPSTPARL